LSARMKTVLGQRYPLFRKTISTGSARARPGWPKPRTSSATSGSLITRHISLPSRIAFLMPSDRSAHPLELPTPMTQSAPGVISGSLVISKVVGWRDEMRGCPRAVNTSACIRYLREQAGINVMTSVDQEGRRARLVESLSSAGYILSPRVRQAFLRVPRELFVGQGLGSNAYVDTPLPIGCGQTISAPSMIAIMLEELKLEPGQKVLEIGAGSGYNAALLYEMVERRVYSVERVPVLVNLARSNLKAAGYGDRVEVVHADGTKGYERESPYDRILVTAGAPRIPQPLVEQLAQGGMIGIPVGGNQCFQEFVTGVKRSNGRLDTRSHGGCAFVPLIGEHGWEE